MTVPADWSLSCWVTFPTRRPLSESFVVAEDWVMPTRFGTSTWSGPVETVIVMAASDAAVFPPSGSWEMTSPASTSSEACSCSLTWNPLLFKVATASALLLPVTSGTSMPLFPVLTVSTTLAPGSMAVPSSTLEEMTMPSSYSEDSL